LATKREELPLIDTGELEKRFREDEGDRVERKRNASDLDDLRKAICALANDITGTGRTGVLFVGQADDKSCAKLQITGELVEKLTNLRGDGKIQPFPIMTVLTDTLDGCPVIAIPVAPSDNSPVRTDGRTYVRVGRSTRVATADEERRLVEKRRWSTLPFDAQGVAGATADDLDLVRFALEYLPSAVAPDVLAENGRTREEQLRALRLLDPLGRPTSTGLLVVGKEPQTWLPGAYVQALRIAGTELTDPIRDQRRIDGTVPDQIRQLDELTDLWIEHPTMVGGPLRTTEPTYPAAALRQLLRNALLHRTYEGSNAPVRLTWYDDRVEIQSPGGPFGQVTLENFGTPGITDYRNPTLAEALRNLHYVEKFGVGLPIASRALSDNGNPPAEFRAEPTYIHVTIRQRPIR
jgi:ATP-dependent DNA helicase RecG